MSKSRMATVPLAELIEDASVYPRHSVDESHVASLVQALRTGATLPSVIAEAASKRLVDGWHRTRAYRRFLGPTDAIQVELRTYATEAALLQDAVALNAEHGRRLDRIDQVRAILLLEQAGVVTERIAAILHIDSARVEKLKVRVALVGGTGAGAQTIPLKRSLIHLAGRELSQEQATAHESQAGTSHLLQVRQLRDALRYDLVNTESAPLLELLRELYAELGRYLAAHAPDAVERLNGAPA